MSRPRVTGAVFDELYAERADPWDFETSAYEAAKYERTIAALAGRRYGRALELGCSIGVLTERLAARTDDLLAVDVADAAVQRARERLAGTPHVTVERREIPEAWPDGPWDLIVCSEVLYYLDPPAFDAALDAIGRTLQPGGSVLAVHWRPATRTYPLTGDEVHALLAERLGSPAWSERTDHYVLDRFERPA